MKGFFTGEKPLWQAFWGIFVGGYVIVFIVNGIITASLVEKVSIRLIAIIISIVTFVYLSIAFITIWRCSENTNWHGWRWIARSIISLVIIISIYSGVNSWSKLIPEIERLIP